MNKTIAICAAVLLGAAVAPAMAAAPVKIGMVTTLSGPGGYLGEDIRDGFKLAIQEDGGKLGGVPVDLIVEDDGQKPGAARQIAARLLESDKVGIFTGIIYTNIVEATVPEILEGGAFYLSANTSPANFAGKGCNKNYFVVGQQNDSQNFAAGEIANHLGFKRMILLAPNYQAGKDAVSAFTRAFKGHIIDDIFTGLHQTDFSAEDAEIAAARPDAVYQFLPGGLGIASLKQYVQAGLKQSIPIIVHAMDGHTLAAVGNAALGVHAAVDWNSDLPNAANKRFVVDFEKTYHRSPTYYAARGYDTARLIGSALHVVNGDLAKADAFRDTLRKADFQSVRGMFKFAHNQHPIQDWYMTEVVKDPSGKLVIKTIDRVLTNFSDPYGVYCKM